MARVLFGTDGIRGLAGEYPLDRKTASAVGAALGRWIGQAHAEPRVVIGMDTRESGPWLAEEVAGGLAAQKVAVDFAGVTTTPGVAYLAKTGPYAAGVMISASHNAYQDNGIKLISHSGYKLPDEQEERLEQDILAPSEQSAQPAALTVDLDLDRSYIEHLAAAVPGSLGGLKIVTDCANGSASFLAPELFERRGARVHSIHCLPNGRNINLNCGSLHLESLAAAVREHSADVGVAFDGDADRALFIAASGKIVDGDAVLLLAARHLKKQGQLPSEGDDGQPVVVATVMSNLGLQLALASHGIRMVRTPVGDKYVLEEMIRRGAVLGGEQSGHIIFHRHSTTGDGMLTALSIFSAMLESGESLDALTSELKVYPQLLVNVRVRERKPLDQLPRVAAEIRAAESSFGDTGRVLVRFSGTEPLARVMVEGPDLQRVEEFAHRIAAQIQADLGAA